MSATSLTEREAPTWLAQGLSNHEIGARMFVSEGAVKQAISRVGDKLGVRSRTGILIRAIQLDLVDPHALPQPGAEGDGQLSVRPGGDPLIGSGRQWSSAA